MKGDGSHCYNIINLKNSDLLVAGAVVMPDKVVPVHLLNQPGDQLICTQELRSMAVLSEV